MKKISLLVAVRALCIALLLSFSSLGLAFSLPNGDGAVVVKVGVLDVNKVLATCPQVKAVQENLKKQFEPKGQAIVKLQDVLKSDVDKYRKNNTALKGKALRDEQQKIIDEQQKLREQRFTFQRDLILAQNEAMRPILKQIEDTVNKIAKEQKFDFIVTKVSVAYNDTNLEITDQVIDAMKKSGVALTPRSTNSLLRKPGQ